MKLIEMIVSDRNLSEAITAVKRNKGAAGMKSQFIGFTFWKDKETWKCKPVKDRIQRLYSKVKEITCRKRAVAKTMAVTFTKLNQVIRGWINYFRIGSMKGQMKLFGEWMRHKVRVVVIKQWKNGATIYRNLQKLNKLFKCNIVDEDIYKVANSRLGWYKRSNGDVVNYLISPKVLAKKTKSRPGLVDPLQYYLSSL